MTEILTPVLRRYETFRWLVALVAEASYPADLLQGTEYKHLWHSFYFQGVVTLLSVYRQSFFDIRWELVRDYSVRRMYDFILREESRPA